MISRRSPMRAGTTRYGWNTAGQQTSETDPLGHRQRWGYDRAGRLVWFRDARGIRSTFEYDAAARPVDKTTAGSVKASYDQAGRRTSLALPGGMRIDYGYDTKGRPVRMSMRGGASVVASYDSKGRLGGLDLPNGVRGRFEYTGRSRSPGSATREVITRSPRRRPATTVVVGYGPSRVTWANRSFRRRRGARRSMPRTRSSSLRLGLDGVGTRPGTCCRTTPIATPGMRAADWSG